jgi:hypothetical protein
MALECYRCGYDLIGTAPEGVCPECGTSVHETVAWMRITLGGKWLVQLRGGALLLLAGPLVLALGFVIALLSQSAAGLGIAALAAAGCWLLGWWFIGTEPPEGLLQLEWAGMPVGVRGCVVLQGVVLVLGLLLMLAGGGMGIEVMGLTLLGTAFMTLTAHWVIGFCLIGYIGGWAGDWLLRFGAFAAAPLPLVAFLTAAMLAGLTPELAAMIPLAAAVWVLAVWGRLWWRCRQLLARK